jgi:hypothetical protein
MRRFLVGGLATVLLALISFTFITSLHAQPPGGPPPGGPGAPPGGPGGRPGGGMMMAAPIDSFVSERDSLVQVILGDLGPKASMPAESVFRHLKVIKGRTAQQVLMTMNRGFGRALGVRCQHCHVLGHWGDEDKNTKQIARDMMAMEDTINSKLLPAIKNIKSDHPGVGCFDCHHGVARPGFGPRNMNAPPPQQAPASK